jgi:signal transduction histidine kinase/ActR/RegA family two-component response regulator
VHGISTRLARVHASLQAKLVWLLLTLALFAVALGWVGFSALEDIHLSGHRMQLLVDWSGDVGDAAEELQGLVVAARVPTAAEREPQIRARFAALDQKLRDLDGTGTYAGIAVGPAQIREMARAYAPDLERVRAGASAVVEAAEDPSGGEVNRLTRVDQAAVGAQTGLLSLAARLQQELQSFADGTDLQHHSSEMALMALVAIAGLASALLGQAAAGSITRPVGAVTSHINRIAQGDFSSGVSVQNRDELGELAGKLNEMAVELDRLYTAERDARRTAEELNSQLAAKNDELEIARAAVQHANDQLEQRVAERTAELEHAHEELRQSQKMEAIGQLAGGIAHDFNNLLTVINGFGELLSQQIPASSPHHLFAGEIQKAGARAASLTQQLLAFSRRQVLDPRVLDLNAVISEMEKMLHRLIGEDIKLVAELDPYLGHVRADPGQIQQVILNLAVNARDAMPQGGTLRITTGACAEPSEATPQPWLVLAVSDTGIGMDVETQARIFDPFFTTKPTGVGTGLGLSTVYGVVQQSGGHIEVESTLGAGTTFRIFLPQVPDELSAENTELLPSQVPGGQETILLVEDEAQVRSLISQLLEQRGYFVLVACGGEEAMLIERMFAGQIDLLLTDVVMPGLSGAEVAERLTARRPDLRVMYMSGYTDEAVLHHGVVREGTTLLQKPFTDASLAHTVRRLLDAPPSEVVST